MTRKIAGFVGLKELNRLQNDTWLNCEVVNWHCCAVAQSLDVDRESVRLLSSGIAQTVLAVKPRLEDILYDHLSSEERQHRHPRSVTSFARVIVPVCHNLHWVVVCIEPEQNCISVYDSLRGRAAHPSPSCKYIGERFRDYVKHQSFFLEEPDRAIRDLDIHYVEDVPRQNNVNDCGVYASERVAKLLGCTLPEECETPIGAARYRAKMLLALMETCSYF